MTDIITESRILSSAAGYYIGTLYLDDELGGWLPWERESFGYYPTREAAYSDLRDFAIGGACDDPEYAGALAYWYAAEGEDAVAAALEAFENQMMEDYMLAEWLDETAHLIAQDFFEELDA